MEYLPFQSDGDELAYVFAGQSLLQRGKPISWSSFETGPRHVWQRVTLGNFDNNAHKSIELIYPWYDNPPLLAYITGAWTGLFGYQFPSIPPSLLIRVIPLGLSVLTITLLFANTRALFDTKTGLAAIIIYGFSPSLSIGNRILIGENLFIPLMLAALLLLQKKKSIAIPIIFNALAVLSKYTGIFSIAVTTLYLVCFKRYKEAALVFLSSLIVTLLSFGTYALFYGHELFIETLSIQGSRLLGWSNPAFILSQPGFHTKPMLDFSYYFILLLGIAGTLIIINQKRRQNTFLNLSIFGSILLIWFTSAEQDFLGWYRLPLFSLLSISAAKVVSSKHTQSIALIVLGILLGNNLGLIRYPGLTALPHPTIMRATLLVLVGIPLMLELFSHPSIVKLKQSCLKIFLILYFFQSFYILDNYYHVLCKDKNCPIPEWQTTQLIKQLF